MSTTTIVEFDAFSGSKLREHTVPVATASIDVTSLANRVAELTNAVDLLILNELGL